MAFYPSIGLEVHVELNTKSKMFCSCQNDSGEKEANKNICPVCLAHPGTLPVINKEAVEKTLKTGLALNCQISKRSFFDRKNYFYPDLPKGYQISQHFAPFCQKGYLEVLGKKVRIREVHLEEDTCKLIHPKEAKFSLVDCNRAGVPLMELVTEPDIESAQEAKQFARELRLVFRYLGVSKADMEKGEMRIEANVSLSEKKGELGIKVELKNINSFKAVEKAIGYEIERQKKILESGQEVIQETRGWEAEKETTVVQRTKETAHDYRYFPEPDLPLLEFKNDYLEKLKQESPELPAQKRERLKKEYRFSDKEIELLVQDRKMGEYFERVASELSSQFRGEEMEKIIKLTFNYLTTDLLGLLKEAMGEEIPIAPENFAKLATMAFKKEISSRTAKQVLKEMFVSRADPEQIVEKRGLVQTSDESEIEEIVKEVMADNEKAVSDFESGKKEALEFLKGQIMAKSRGKANPQIVEKILKKLLQP